MNLLQRVWRDAPGKHFCVSTKDRAGVWRDHFFKRSQFKREMVDFITNNKDKDLYWCPHGFSKPRRLKRFAEIPKMLWADLDEVNPRDLTDLTPTIAIESSPGRYYGLWLLDSYMTEDVNRRLTYHIKADPGGWDLTQVIRIPDTLNFKYESTPKVKLMWQDGPVHLLSEFVKNLPKERKARETDAALGIYRKYESKFNGWIRRQLLKGKPKPGKRSEVLWRLTNELVEAGCTVDEAFELLRVSPWNKFSKRRDGDEQLRRELDKALSQHLRVDDDETHREPFDTEEEDLEDEDEEYKFLAQSMAEVEEENIDWLWYPYLARGELTILEGDPGLGKSYLAQMAAASLCDGDSLPSAKRQRNEPIKVAYFDIENSTGSVTKKRLTLNGCKNLSNFFQEPEPFSVDDESAMEGVYEAIDRLRPSLVVFDTMGTYLGGADTHNAVETMQAFRRFVDIARRFECAVLVLRHLTKSSKEKALYRGQGSIAFAGLARVVMVVGRLPDDPETRVMAVSKINVCRPPKGLCFRIDALPDTLTDQDRSKFSWGNFVDVTADQIVAPPEEVEDDGGDGVVAWLKDTLAGGPVEMKVLVRMAEPRSYAEDQLERACAEIGADIDDGWVGLPEHAA